MREILTLLLAFGMLYFGGCGEKYNQETSKEKLFKTEWESLNKHNPEPEWFRDTKFGIYFHWEVYSVPAYESEWYPRNMFGIVTCNRI